MSPIARSALRLYGLAGVCIASAIATAALISVSGHRIVVNDSPSMPRGFYWMTIGATPSARGEVVMFRPDAAWAARIYGRGWLPAGMPLLKTVGGLPGDEYCVRDGRFLIAGSEIGPVFRVDSQGRPIPQIGGCRRVGNGEFLPIAKTFDRSVDGRYMGSVPVRNVLGVGHALMTF